MKKHGDRKTLYAHPSNEIEGEIVEIRSDINNALLGLLGNEGLYYWERRSNTRHVLTWAEILEQYQKKQSIDLQIQTS